MNSIRSRTGWRVLAGGLLSGGLAALALPAAAIAVAGPGGTAEPSRRVVVDAPAPGANLVTLDLVRARIDAVDLAGGTLTLQGQKVPLHAQQLRVLGPSGQVLGPHGLRAGQTIRLALDPQSPASAASAAAALPRRIVLIYIDG